MTIRFHCCQNGSMVSLQESSLYFQRLRKKKCFVKKCTFFFYFSGHFEWSEANDNILYKSAYLNSSMCRCSSKNCHFQFHYSMTDNSVLKAVLFTNQVRRNMRSFSKGKYTSAQVLPSKMQGNMPASTCLSPKLVFCKTVMVSFH